MPKTPIRTDDLYRFQVVSGAELSPDGARVVFAVERVDRDSEKKYSNLWVAPTDRAAKLWDVETRQEMAPLTGSTDGCPPPPDQRSRGPLTVGSDAADVRLGGEALEAAHRPTSVFGMGSCSASPTKLRHPYAARMRAIPASNRTRRHRE